MRKSVIIYWSGTGNTEAMAHAIAEGASFAGQEIPLFEVSSISANAAKEYDNLILGCPPAGSEVLEEYEFEPFFAELEGNIKGKNIALFGSYGWGDGEWMRDWEDRVREADATLLDGEGLIINEMPDDAGLDLCRALGARVSKM